MGGYGRDHGSARLGGAIGKRPWVLQAWWGDREETMGLPGLEGSREETVSLPGLVGG